MAADDMMIEAVLSADASGMVNGFNAASRAATGFQKKLAPLNGLMNATGVAFGAAGFAAIKMGRQAFDSAARVSELKVAIDAIGKATGVGGDKINEAAKKIRDNGIEMAAAQKIAITYAQNNLDLGRAADIARVAQDLAVISQRNSTDTAELLTRAIQTGNSQLLKSAGISRMAGEAYDMYAKQLGKSSTSLTATERQTAVMNLIMEEGTRVAGIYTAAMTEPGKVLRSFPRLYNDMQVAIGGALLKGFGPLIKAGYDLTNAFSKTLREGGALYPMVETLGKVMQNLLDPLTGSVKYLTIVVKSLDQFNVSVDGAAAKVEKFLPLIASLGSFLSLRVGRNFLSTIPMFEKAGAAIGKFAGPAGIGILIATSPRLREAFMKIVKAVSALIPPLLKLAAGVGVIMNALVEDITDVVVVLVGPLSGAVKVAADMIGFLARNALILKPLIYAIGTALMVSAVKSMWAASMASEGLAFNLVKVGTTAGGAATRLYSNFMYSLKVTGSATQAFAGTAVAAFKTVGAAAASMAASLVSLLAPMLAIYVAVRVFKALGDAQKQAAARSTDLRKALEENVAALKGNKQAILDYASSVQGVGKDLLATGDDGKALTAAMNDLGLPLEKVVSTMLRMKGSFGGGSKAQRDFMVSVLETNGVTGELASRIAKAVDENEKLDDVLAVVQQRVNGVDMSPVSDRIKALVTQLEMLDDQAEKFDFSAVLNARIREISLLGAGEAKMAREIEMRVRQEQARKGVTDADMVALRVMEALDRAMKLAEDASKKHTKSLVDSAQASTNTSQNFGLLVRRLDEMKLAEGEVKYSTEQLAEALYGIEFVKKQELEKAIYDIRSSMDDLFTRVEDGKGNMDSLTGAALDLGSQLTEAATNSKNLGLSSGEVAAQQSILIGQFLDAAKAGKYQDDKVKGLLQTLGILKNYRTKIVIDADIEGVQKKLSGLVAFLAKLGGDADPFLRKYYYDLQQQLKSLTTEQRALSEGTQTYARIQKDAKDKTGGASEAAKKLKDRLEALRAKIKETYGDAIELAKDNLDELAGKHKDLRDAIRDVVVNSLSMADAFSKAESGQQALAEAQKNYDDASARLSYVFAAMQGQIAGVTVSLDDYVNAVSGAAEAEKQLAAAQSAGTDFLANMKAQYEQATKFAEMIRQFRSGEFGAKLNEAGIRQLINAGAEQGLKIGEALQKGGAQGIQDFNSWSEGLDALGTEMGQTIANDFYGVGVSSAQSLYDGLVAKWAELEPKLAKLKMPELKLELAKAKGVLATTSETVDAITGVKPDSSTWFTSMSPEEVRGIANWLGGFPAMGQGGVVTQPTLSWIGEKGPEAVIPLDRLGNTQQGAASISVTVNAGMGTDGKSVGQAIVEELVSYQRRVGVLPFKIQGIK